MKKLLLLLLVTMLLGCSNERPGPPVYYIIEASQGEHVYSYYATDPETVRSQGCLTFRGYESFWRDSSHIRMYTICGSYVIR